MTLRPETTFLRDLHRYEYREAGIEVRLERFQEDRRDGLIAEMSVITSRDPAPGLLHHGRVNLSSSRSREGVLRALERRGGNGFLADVDFGGILEQVCYRSLERWREGEPTIDLREVDPNERQAWLLYPFVEAGANLIFGDGSTGKSLLAEAIVTSVASGQPIIGQPRTEPCPGLLLDWETDPQTHAERFRAICAGAGIEEPLPAVFYRRMVASLTESAPTIRKEIAKLGIGFVVIDSMGAARGGDPESADTTIRLFAAARSLGVPWLGTDHLPKNAHDKSKPFGSAYSHNLARLTWGVERAQEPGSDTITVALTNYKRNNGKLVPRQAHRVQFTSGEDERLRSVTFSPCDVADVPDLLERLPVKDRILATLRDGKMDARSIADALEIGQDQARVRLNELARAGRVVRLGQEWGLPAHV